MQLTPQQRRTLESREKNILVSASAGSGKTAVLVKRVISRLTDPVDPCDITRFIIVTYTNAAAAEMRSRIASAINSALAEDPSDRHLKRQLALLPSARISTVHSFCLRLIRENFQLLGIDPSFRLADEEESDSLRREVASETVADGYGDPVFEELSANISSLRNDTRLVDAVLSVYNVIAASADAEESFVSWRDSSADTEGMARRYLSLIKPEAAFRLERARESLEELMSSEDEKLISCYGDAFASDLARIENFTLSLERGWDEASRALALLADFPNLGSAGKLADKTFADRLKRSRDRLKDFAGRLKEGILALPWEAVAADAEETCRLAERFFELVGEFSKRYAAAKLERGIADFSDLEQLAIRLLIENGEPTELANAVGNTADELMVDEFQDTNSAQSAIFRAITERTDCAFFAVGDVKQSIYRFRQADPTIFLARRERADEKIFLDKNFRSLPCVIDAVNDVFERIMSVELGEVDYGSTETLVAERKNPEGFAKTSFEVIDLKEGEEKTGSASAEASYIANRIKGLLSSGMEIFDKDLGVSRPLRQSDIAILLRASGQHGPAIASALERAGIDSVGGTRESLLSSADVLALTDLLRAVDNPTREPELAGAMLSPLVGFTPDELGLIRIKGGKDGFYRCLKTAAEGEDCLGEKCRGFLSLLERLRTDACGMTVGGIVWRVCELTDAVSVVSAAPDGGARREDLEAFFALAAAWGDSRPSATVGDFLRYVDKSRERSKDSSSAAGRGVRIMTVHASKGLEFPVVILAGLGKRANIDWKKSPLQLHRDAGAGFMKRESSGLTERTTLCREYAMELLEREQLSEELRVLYVAMTRAREQLIMVASFQNAQKKLVEVEEENVGGISSEYCCRAASFGEWIAAAVACGAGRSIDMSLLPPEALADTADRETERVEPDPELTERIADMLEKSEGLWSAPTPAKLTATQYKKLTLEQGEGPIAKTYRQPKFISGGGGRLTPAERGSAMHLVMQLIPPHKAAEADAAEFIGSLVAKNILSPSAAAELDPSRVSAFFTSEVGREMIENLPSARREFRFTLPLAADRWTGGKGELLLQGVVDLFWEDAEGRISVVDYKTDRIRPGYELERAESYRPQLEVYADALEKIVGKPIKASYIYFFETGRTVKVL